MMNANRATFFLYGTEDGSEHRARGGAGLLSRLLYPGLFPLPLPLVQIPLNRIVRYVHKKRPDMFDRIGVHKDKIFTIDPVNLPFALLLCAHPQHPFLRACRRRKLSETDARIAGTFLTLLDMVDGRLDGDALFFSREIIVEGDTEAVVCLRNALDDLEGSVAEDAAELFGSAGRAGLSFLRKMRRNAN